MNFSNITIGGHLVKDAEKRSTAAGKQCLRFSVGVNTGYGDQKKTTWFNVVAWGEGFVKLADYLTKGKAVLVNGELSSSTREYQGKNITSLDINAREIKFAGGEKQQGSDKPKQNTLLTDEEEERIPF